MVRGLPVYKTANLSALVTGAAGTNDNVRPEVSRPSREGHSVWSFQQHTKEYGVASEAAVKLINPHLQIVDLK